MALLFQCHGRFLSTHWDIYDVRYLGFGAHIVLFLEIGCIRRLIFLLICLDTGAREWLVFLAVLCHQQTPQMIASLINRSSVLIVWVWILHTLVTARVLVLIVLWWGYFGWCVIHDWGKVPLLLSRQDAAQCVVRSGSSGRLTVRQTIQSLANNFLSLSNFQLWLVLDHFALQWRVSQMDLFLDCDGAVWIHVFRKSTATRWTLTLLQVNVSMVEACICLGHTGLLYKQRTVSACKFRQTTHVIEYLFRLLIFED